MDKYEYRLRLEQIKKYYNEEKYKEAAKVADTIDWRKVKDWSTLAMVINIYDETEQLEDAKNVCIHAYNRKLGGRRLVYKLAELFIRLGDLEDAKEVYDEFVKMAPKDISRYTLLYRLNVAKGADTEVLIGILNEYKNYDRDEQCLYELACLYEKAGMIEKCMAECDEIILWFNGGDYFESALKLKRKYGALTHNQKLMLERVDSRREDPVFSKKSVTIELPRGVLKAEDIIRAATGRIDVQETEADTDSESADNNMAESKALEENLKASADEEVFEPENTELKRKEQDEPVEAVETQEQQEEASADELTVEEEKAPVEEAPADEDRHIAQEPVTAAELLYNVNNTVKIPIPDYSLYDTTNIQKELAESIRPYIDGLDEEEEVTDAPKKGDIIDTAEGVFKIVPDTKRIIVPGANYKLVELTPEEAEELETQKQEEALSEDNEEIPVISGVEEVSSEVPATEEESANEDEPVTNEEVISTEEILSQDASITEENEALIIEEEVQASSEIAVTTEDDEEESGEAQQSEEEFEQEMLKTLEEALAKETTNEDNQPVKSKTIEELASAIEVTVEEVDDEEENPLEITTDIAKEIGKSLSKVEEAKAVSPIFAATLEDISESKDKRDVTEPKVEYKTDYDRIFKKYFGKYINLKGMKKQIYNVMENVKSVTWDGTSKKGNLVIAGNESLNKEELAIAFVRAYNEICPEHAHKIAKVSAETLNTKGIEPVLHKLVGSALIVEDASQLSDDRVAELIKTMKKNTEGMMVILIDTESRIIKFLGNNAKLSMYFDNLIEVRKYNVNELVEMAKNYALEQNCMINDKALLKLYLVIDKLNTGIDTSDMKMVESVIDSAIVRANERMEKSLFGLRKMMKNRDGVLTLKEADISTELIDEE